MAKVRSHSFAIHLGAHEIRPIKVEAAAAALTEIKNSSKEACQVELIKMDVTNYQDIIAARKVIEQAVREDGLTLLINNAGAAKAEAFPNITEENLLMHFKINTVGPIRVFQEMLPLLQKSAARNASPGGMRVSRAAVLNITSMAGSITRTGVEFVMDLAVPGYKTSKVRNDLFIDRFHELVEKY